MSTPKLAFFGPMLGRNQGYVTTQGEFLTDLFRESGYDVISSSVRTNRFRRLADMISTLRRELDQVDLVVVETYSGPSFVVEDLLSLITRTSGKPLVFHIHGGAMPRFAARFPRWTGRVLGRGAAIVAPSAFLARELAPRIGTVRIIPNVVEVDGYPTKLRGRVAPRLFWMRAYHAIYNPEMALRVLARVRQTHPDATLVMAGQDKGMKSRIIATARGLQLGDSVRIIGFLDEREKRALADEADIFLNTTHVDNAPVGVVEMGAMGLPIVSTGVGGVPDMLRDGETGLLVPDNDDAAMAAAIVRLVSDDALAARLSRNGPTLAARCAWSAVRAQWETLFVELLSLTSVAA